MSMKLYVGNLAFQTTDEDLQDLFSQAGTVESVSIVTDRDTGRSRGFAFVEMASKEEGEAAIAQFHGREIDGRSLTVNEAKPREPRGGWRRAGYPRASVIPARRFPGTRRERAPSARPQSTLGRGHPRRAGR